MLTLTDNQTTAISKLSYYKVGALFMEPGTGKTRTAYELVKSVKGIDYVLWLTPFQTKANLLTEIIKCGGFNCELDIIGIETLSSSDRTYLQLYNKLQTRNSVVVCDESLKIKNWEAKRTKRIIDMGKLSTYKLILNGTPLSKNLLDIWAQMEFLSPMILNMGIAEFKNTFCEYTTITKRSGYKVYVKEYINKYHNVDYLYSLIGHYVYECDLQLETQRQYLDWSYAIDEETMKNYTFIKEKYLDNEMLQFKNNNIFLELTQKLQHMYCCTEEKFELLKKFFTENDPAKTIIACKFIASTLEVTKRYPDVKVLSYGKHAYGLNLQEYDTVIFFDKTWDYAQREQFEHRIFRLGQQSKVCRFFDFTGNVGLESLINKNIDKKQSLLEYFKNKSIEEIKKEL